MQFQAILADGWSIYASDFDPDLGPGLTTVTFKPNNTFQTVGKLASGSGVQEKYDMVWKGKCRYFTRQARFTQKVKILKPNPVLEGALTYQTYQEVEGYLVPNTTDFGFVLR